MCRDWLLDVYKGKFSSEEYPDHVMVDFIHSDSFHFDGREDFLAKLKMNKVEYTAFLHGADLSTIAKWRYEGWPEFCLACGKSIYPEKSGWTIREVDDIDYLIHISCLDSYHRKLIKEGKHKRRLNRLATLPKKKKRLRRR